VGRVGLRLTEAVYPNAGRLLCTGSSSQDAGGALPGRAVVGPADRCAPSEGGTAALVAV